MTSANAHSTHYTEEALVPARDFRLLVVGAALATVVVSSLAAPIQAKAHVSPELASGPIIAATDISSGTGMPMKGMGAMMRPDMAPPPQGVVGGMSPKQSAIMPVLQYMHMGMDGNRDGTSDISTAKVLARYPVAPLNMDVNMLMGGVMYGITADISVMAIVPYVWKSMDHVTRMGVGFTTKSEGFGDLRLIGGYDVYKMGGHKINLSAGLSFPTGSTDERDDPPAGSNQLLPYAAVTTPESRPARARAYDPTRIFGTSRKH